MVNMLVKIWLSLTKAVITGDVDEVRVQSEEPDSSFHAYLYVYICLRFSKLA